MRPSMLLYGLCAGAMAMAMAMARAEAPYPHSRLIESMSWHWDEGYSEANGSDLWPATWGADGETYVFFGDGGGFGGTDQEGRTSFGIARMMGPPVSLKGPPAGRANVFGGYQALHAATLVGKASSIAAVGADFYAIASVYAPDEAVDANGKPRSGSPDHVEIAYSRGNAYSWRVASWRFCGARFAHQADPLPERYDGLFCPGFFIGFGPGNAGAPGGYAYLVGVENAGSLWRSVPAPIVGRSYLARVPASRLLKRAAYEFYAGLDARGAPQWSREVHRMQPIFSDPAGFVSGCGSACNMGSALADMVYLPALRRYLAVAQGDSVAQTSFYEAPQPWGPWSVIEYHDIDPASGQGGWAGLGIGAGVALGVHPINAWTSADGRRLWMVFSSNGVAPRAALFPPAGTALDAFNLVRVDLNLRQMP